jgi:hypothetical protein
MDRRGGQNPGGGHVRDFLMVKAAQEPSSRHIRLFGCFNRLVRARVSRMLLGDATLAVATQFCYLLFGLLNGGLQQVVKGRAALISRKLGELLRVQAHERDDLLSV